MHIAAELIAKVNPLKENNIRVKIVSHRKHICLNLSEDKLKESKINNFPIH